MKKKKDGVRREGGRLRERERRGGKLRLPDFGKYTEKQTCQGTEECVVSLPTPGGGSCLLWTCSWS